MSYVQLVSVGLTQEQLLTMTSTNAAARLMRREPITYAPGAPLTSTEPLSSVAHRNPPFGPRKLWHLHTSVDGILRHALLDPSKVDVAVRS